MMGILLISLKCVHIYLIEHLNLGTSQTEIVFSTDQHCVSYVQVRGSVPCMYFHPAIESPSLLPLNNNVVLQCFGNSKVYKPSDNGFKSRALMPPNQLSSVTSPI
jgi:hypothetical protein